MTPRVRVVGTGLLGTSAGLALTRAGYPVRLSDPSPTALALARDLGAGVPAADDPADVVLVAAPPDVVAEVVLASLRELPEAVVTDVASVKGVVLEAVLAGADPQQQARYVGSHPMAGRERSGAVAAREDLFDGRTWVVCPHDGSDPGAVRLVADLAVATGAVVQRMDAHEHDRAVAAVSHLPQLVASLAAGRLRDLPEASVALAGQGVRDVTRIAASDPLLWTQILAGNAAALAPVVDALVDDLEQVRQAVRALARAPGAPAAPGARGVLAQAVARGREGQARLPGKHGAPAVEYASLVVVLTDRPGRLGRLFTDVGEAGANLEDVRIEHVAGRRTGLVELSVLPAALGPLRALLTERGWATHG